MKQLVRVRIYKIGFWKNKNINLKKMLTLNFGKIKGGNMKKNIIFAFVFLFIINHCYSQWKQINGICGQVNCTVISGNDIYAGTH